MSKLSNQWIDIFAVGDYGEKGNFSQADLDGIIRNYTPSVHEAPVVIGHPESDAPAFGWVESLRRVGDVLQAQFKQVVPAFADAVEAGLYKKRSVSLYDSAKGWSLRHVGFLGAMPPEIKGLADIKFANEDIKSISIDFEEDSMAVTPEIQEQALFDRLTAWIKKNFNELTQPGASVLSFSPSDVQAAVDKAIAGFQSQVEAEKSAFSEAQAKLNATITASRSASAITKLKAAGLWVPAFEKLGLVQVFEELAQSDSVVTFGEGASKASSTAFDLLVSFMEQLPAIVPSTTVYKGAQSVVSAKEYANPGSRVGVDENSVRLHEAAVAFSESNKVSYAEALSSIARKHPELTLPGSATVGAV